MRFFAASLLALACACGGARAGAVRLAAWDGEVASVRDGKMTEAKENGEIRVSDAVRVAHGSAVLTADGIRATLYGPGRVEAVRSAPGRVALACGAGTIRIEATGSTPRVAVGGPSAALRIDAPGEYWISVAEDGASLLGVAAGAATVRTGARPPQDLAAGEEVEVSADGALGRVHRRIVRSPEDAGFWLAARAEGMRGREADLAVILEGQARADGDRFHRLAEAMESAAEGAGRAEDVLAAAHLALTRRAAAEYLAGVRSGAEAARDDSRRERRARRALERLEKRLE